MPSSHYSTVTVSHYSSHNTVECTSYSPSCLRTYITTRYSLILTLDLIIILTSLLIHRLNTTLTPIYHTLTNIPYSRKEGTVLSGRVSRATGRLWYSADPMLIFRWVRGMIYRSGVFSLLLVSVHPFPQSCVFAFPIF